MAVLTLFDLITLQRNDPITGLVEDVTTYAPEFGVLPVVPRAGITYTIVRRTAYPTVGFHNVNEGGALTKSAFKKEVKEMFWLDAPISVPEAVIKADDKSVGDVWMLEARGVFEQALITLGAQLFYGTSSDAKGFSGVRAQLAGVIAANSTSPTAAATTTAYLLNMDPQYGCRFDVGNAGSISMSAPTRQQTADPADSTKFLMSYVGNLSCWIGFSVMSAYATWGVTGIDASNVLTDGVGQKLISNIPGKRRQGLRWFMNRLSEYLLTNSRTAITYQLAGAAGTPAYSPLPTMLNGYPITVTDSITNTETN